MVSRQLSAFRGELSAKDVADGINAAIRNSKRLAADAKLMLDAKRYPTAAALAIYSLEETEKVSTLRALSVAQTKDELGQAWEDYRSNRTQNSAWIAAELDSKGAGHLSGFSEAMEKDAYHSSMLTIIKRLGLHTECYRKGYWSEPSVVIDANAAAVLVRIAENACAKNEISDREIALWVEHVGPAWHSSKMPDALLRWAQAMEEEGLIKPATDDVQRIGINLADPGGDERRKKYRH
jgi:AbiV family abortive infection protein